MRALDVFSVVQPPGRRYFAFLSIYFGMMANLDIGTDHLRCTPHVLFPPTICAALTVAWLGVWTALPSELGPAMTSAFLLQLHLDGAMDNAIVILRRWMGSVRFTLGAIHEVLQQRRYEATVAYLPAAGSSGTQNKAHAVGIHLCLQHLPYLQRQHVCDPQRRLCVAFLLQILFTTCLREERAVLLTVAGTE
jgi:hypothetical protein